MKSILRWSIGILFVALGVSGFCQGVLPSQLHSVSPSVWVLKGDGEVLVLPPPTTFSVFLPGGLTLEMVKIPAGTFMMGRYAGEQDSYLDESPQHPVTISRDFYLGKYEVTKAQWMAVMGSTPWSGQDFVRNDPDSPAVYISWNDCQDFIDALNRSGQGIFRLPSEAEWEFACRAGTTTRFYWGDDPSYIQIGSYAWYWGNCSNEWHAHGIGLKKQNGRNLYDMSGNVWEWCQDWYGTYPSGAVTDPVGSASGNAKVLRGGGWYYQGDNCRSAYRNKHIPVLRRNYFGFRLARTP